MGTALLMVLLTVACGKSKPPVNKKILTLGDSITEGERNGVLCTETFTYYLGDYFRNNGFRDVSMIREGISGENTSQVLRRLQRDVVDKKPTFVTIMYGTNDAFIDVQNNPDKTSPRIPLDIYEKNLIKIIRTLKQNNITPILMTPIPMGHFWIMDIGIYKEKGPNFLLKQYAETVRRIASRENLPLVDHYRFWQEKQKKGQDLNLWLVDGLHPNPRGHRIMARAIFKILKTLVPR
jgi:isoamyl acetate esterase